MSSRWDALKPSSSRHSTKRSSRCEPSKNANGIATQVQLGKQKHSISKSTWQTSGVAAADDDDDDDGRGEQTSHKQSPGKNFQFRQDRPPPVGQPRRHDAVQHHDETSNAEWNMIVGDLHEWSFTNSPGHKDVKAATNQHDPSVTNTNSSTTKNHQTRDLGKISKSLSRLARDENKCITEGQRGAAVAAALNVLNSVNDDETVVEILECCCDILADLPPSRTKHNLRDNPQAQEAAEAAIRITTCQARGCIQGLVHTQPCLADYHTKTMLRSKHQECCVRVLIALANSLPPEETCRELVEQNLIPLLESIVVMMSNSPGVVLDTDQKMLLLLGFQAMQGLLHMKKHASALLAPLVKDVAVNGEEIFLVNPLRKRTFQLLQTSLQLHLTSSSTTTTSLQQDWSIQLMEAIYNSLTTALNQANDVDKSSTSTPLLSPRKLDTTFGGFSSSRDLDALVMERFFKDTFNRHDFQSMFPIPSLRKQVLQVMLAYLKHHPDASLSMGSILLLRETQRVVGTPEFSVRSAEERTESSLPNPTISCLPPFLKLLLETKTGSEESDLLMTSLALLLAKAPLKLWLGITCHQRQGTSGTVSYFSNRVSQALSGILVVTACLLETFANTWKCRATARVDAFLSLFKATLLSIPYKSILASSQGEKIVESACTLFAAFSHVLVHEDIYPYAPLDRLIELYDEAMGGRILPCGTRTSMIMPARNMLSVPSSRSFLDEIFSRIERAARIATERAATLAKPPAKLLRSILRTRPETVLHHRADWERYKSIVQELCDSDNATRQTLGLEMLEALLVGRQQDLPPGTLAASAETVSKFVFNLLPRTLNSNSGPCRRLSLLAYGCLLRSDWCLPFDRSNIGTIKHHVGLILGHCIASEPVSSVRSVACKATGDICSNCFLRLDRPESRGVDEYPRWRECALEMISADIFATMQLALKDDAAPVRSMAGFAIGNLAQVVLDTKLKCDPETLMHACLAVYECMGDENEKAGANAIRSVGHLAAFALRPDCSKDLDHLGWGLDMFCTKLVEALTDKVAALPDLTRSAVSGTPTLSWKQRSTAKKCGRVACNTLALLLKHWTIPEEALAVWRSALDRLVKCVESLGTSLDEKVVIAAMVALQAVSPSVLAKLSGKSAIVGRALVACICWMAKEWWSKGSYISTGKLTVQVELAARHFMESASTTDASMVISCEDIADAWMEHVYEWMVLNNCSARAFDVFTLALQKSELRLPVTVEHKFAKRAMNLFQTENHASDNDDEL